MEVSLTFTGTSKTYDYRKAKPLKRQGVESVVDDELKSSIESMGLLSPLHYWICPLTGEYHYVDGNGRYAIFLKYDARLKGVSGQDAYLFPCLIIKAKDKAEAIRILLEKEKTYNKWVDGAKLLEMCTLGNVDFDKVKKDLLPTLNSVWEEGMDLMDLALGDVEQQEQSEEFTAESESPPKEDEQEKGVASHRKRLSKMLGLTTAGSPFRISRMVDVLDWENKLLGDVLDYGGGNDMHGYPIYDATVNPDVKLLLNKYDTIICSNVLTHYTLQHQWIETLMTINTLLKDGGVLYLGSFDRMQKEDALEKGLFFNGCSLEGWHKDISLLFNSEIYSEKDGILAIMGLKQV